MNAGPEEGEVAVVVDNGSSELRAGFSGDDEPRLQWRNVVGTPGSEEQMLALGLKDRYIGEEAQRERTRLALNYPMKGGQVTDWDAIEQVWQAVFHGLGADPTDRAVLMSDRPLTPRPHRERMTETMFETFQVPGFYVMNQAVLCMTASGRAIAIILDCGEGATTVMPIEELSIRPHAVCGGGVTGADLTEYLRTLLMQRAYEVTEGLETVREIKESLCYISDDFRGVVAGAQGIGSSSPLDKVYELPDGQRISLNEERVNVPEALFQPCIMGKCGAGVHELLFNSIRMCDIDARKHFFHNIIPVGGTTYFPGFHERLQKEVEELVPPTVNVKVVTLEERKLSAFIGGSIIASLSMFHNCWISRQDYDEHGPALVHQKCT